MTRSNHRSTILAATVAAVAATSLLAGCANHSSRHFTVGSTPSSYKQTHPIVLDERQRILDVPVGSASSGLTLDAKQSVMAFAGGYHREKGSAMQILIPGGSGNHTAARHVSNAIADVLKSEGVPSHAVHMGGYDASAHGAAAPVRIAYRAITASVSGCGKWDKDLTDTADNANYHNFGCASQNNLAEMVDNPADLLGPRAPALIEPARRTNVIGKYIGGESTASSTTYRPATAALQ